MLILAVVLGTAACGSAVRAEDAPAGGTPPYDAYVIPAPEPFTVDAYSAVQIIAMLKRVGLIEIRQATAKPEIVAVLRVWAVPAGEIATYPPGHRRRYDIVLNGSPIDWDHAFIAYDQGMVNLRALFTYRNQYPPSSLVLQWP